MKERERVSERIYKRLFYCLILFLFLILLMAGCDGSVTPPTQVAQDVIPRVQVIPSGNPPEKRIISEEVISQNNCGGSATVSSTVGRSYSVVYTLEIGAEMSVDASGSVGLPGVGEVEIGVEVATNYGVTYGREESLSRSLTVSAKEETSMLHSLQQVEYWETGELVIVYGEKEKRYPYSFRRDFGIELVKSENMCCPSSTLVPETPMLPSPTPYPVTPSASPTDTPLQAANTPVLPTDTPAPVETPMPTPVLSTNTPVLTETPTHIPTPAPSAEGKIAFVSDRDGDAEIFVMGENSQNLQQITHNSVGDRHPSWSPEGSQIAFTREGHGIFPDIYVMHDDGSDEYLLVDHHAFDIWPAWSPTGEWIAFQTNRNGNWDIYLIKPDGSDLRRLTTHPADDQMPAWAADGTRVYFQSSRGNVIQIYSVNTMGEQEKHHVASGFDYQCPRPSPVAGRLAFQSPDQDGNPEIYMEVEGRVWRVTDAVFEEKTPEWSPDGQKIAFVSARNGKFDIYFVGLNDIFSMGPSGTPWRNLVVGSGNNEDPAWWGR